MAHPWTMDEGEAWALVQSVYDQLDGLVDGDPRGEAVAELMSLHPSTRTPGRMNEAVLSVFRRHKLLVVS